MILQLALLQLPFLYLTTLVVGLAVYGSELDEPQGRVYELALLALLALPVLLRRRAERFAGSWPFFALMLGGIVLAGWTYRPLHLGFWDENSIPQAVGFALLGLVSLFAALAAGARLPQAGGDPRRARATALALIALVWLGAAELPMLSVLGLALAFALAAWLPVLSPRAPELPPAGAAPGGRAALRYGIVLAVLDLSLPIWDYQHDPVWGTHLGLGFLAMGLGTLFAGRSGARGVAFAVGAGSANYVLAALAPDYALTLLHSVVAGSVIGVLLDRLLGPERRCTPLPFAMRGASLLWVIGLLLGHGFAQAVAFAGWRVLLLLPFAALPLNPRRELPRAA